MPPREPQPAKPWSDRRAGRRDRVRYDCPNCSLTLQCRPDQPVVCGRCFLLLQESRPPGYPERPYGLTKAPRFQVDPASLPVAALVLPPHIRTQLEQPAQQPPAPLPPVERPTPVVRPTKAKGRKAELESAADHCRRWLDHHEAALDGLKPKPLIPRYLDALDAADDPVFLVSGWNGAVAPLFGVTGEAVRQAKNAWFDSQGAAA